MGGSTSESPSQAPLSPQTIHLPKNILGHLHHTTTDTVNGLQAAIALLPPFPKKVRKRTGGDRAAKSGVETAFPTIHIDTSIRPRRTNVVAAARHLTQPQVTGSTNAGEAQALSHLPLAANTIITTTGQAERKVPGRQGLGRLTIQWPPVVHPQIPIRTGGIDQDR